MDKRHLAKKCSRASSPTSAPSPRSARSTRARGVRIDTAYDPKTIAIGASISCAGVCLTVVTLPDGGSNARWFEVEAWEEALRLTTAAGWQAGSRINLERALKIGDELGGHIVSGHVDGMAEIVARKDEGEAVRFTLEAPRELAKFIAPKGSVALDGTSLTVNGVDGTRFDVLLIHHSLAVTTWGERKVGDRVNLEVDTMARYAARLAEAAMRKACEAGMAGKTKSIQGQIKRPRVTSPGIAKVLVDSWNSTFRGLLPDDFLDGMSLARPGAAASPDLRDCRDDLSRRR